MRPKAWIACSLSCWEKGEEEEEDGDDEEEDVGDDGGDEEVNTGDCK
eukprot:CAMPEP_0201514308 /NCGR_PEP_ID=MMETSP0161_2-20130828/6169_1 /ASSEMBLY_ACC=CAM_ASM_000251 /TAXON_ID=180227 /ORGANISM="Neoparamoeba aestuarina, Strain SoJaBio B1-5/56/2" /LENGTH=46 /DNA_ID= /DNA_START= /DNA_END= /DNA_ORIENTATION=